MGSQPDSGHSMQSYHNARCISTTAGAWQPLLKSPWPLMCRTQFINTPQGMKLPEGLMLGPHALARQVCNTLTQNITGFTAGCRTLHSVTRCCTTVLATAPRPQPMNGIQESSLAAVRIVPVQRHVQALLVQVQRGLLQALLELGCARAASAARAPPGSACLAPPASQTAGPPAARSTAAVMQCS